MKFVYLILLLVSTKMLYAHQPDLSNFMIYEQNGRSILVMKSSLTAFEGEIDYHYNKNAYKTPEEFSLLVIKHFEKNCFLVINNDTIRFINPKIILGHETTLFAELGNTPETVESFYIRNTFFKDMPDNMCELILTTRGLPLKQYILNNSNNHEAKLKVENQKWVIEGAGNTFFEAGNYPLWIAVLLMLLIVVAQAGKKKKIPVNAGFIPDAQL